MRLIKTVIFLGVVLASQAAIAQPVTSPASCAVRVIRAPDDVRQTVEAWVAAEPRCSVALDVRIIPTDGGLYLFALDEHGRIRERIVPDAQSAGVLVASWVADDTMYVPPSPPPAPPVEKRDPFSVRGSGPNSDLTTPGMTLSNEPVAISLMSRASSVPLPYGVYAGIRFTVDDSAAPSV